MKNKKITIDIDELPDNVIILQYENGNYILSDMNQNAQKTEKVSKEEFIGKKLVEAFPAVKEFGFCEVLDAVHQDGKAREFGTRLYEDERIKGWYYSSVRKLASGELIVFYKDMTEHEVLKNRVQTLNSEQIREEQKVHLLAKALQQADDMVLITNAEGIIEYVNDSVVLKTGYQRDELIGKKTNIFRSGKHTDEFYKNLWTTILSGKNYQNIVIDKTKDGQLYYADLKITPLYNENHEIKNFVATSTDITARVEMEKRLEKLATMDSLTGIYNRYKIDNEINRHIARYKRYGEVFSILMFDIDFFKKINDKYGHDVGDKVLSKLSELVRKNIRTTDIAGRWGGEEFVVLLENTKLDEAYNIAEKIRELVESYMIDNKYNITISIGVVEYRKGESREDLVKRADEALYLAKERGRNQVVA